MALILADRSFNSHLLLGTARYPDQETLMQAIVASGAEIVTVSMRRWSAENHAFSSFLKKQEVLLLPNTAGCYTAKDAILTAQLAQEALGTNWIKLEVIGDQKTLFPDTTELLIAAQELILQGFVVLPYCSDDPVVCRKLAEMGCAAVMPLGAPIGSGLGLCNPHNIRLIREMVEIPLIIDAGLGTASDVAIAMELGADGVLVNTAVAQAREPVAMAEAMKLACQAGRLAYQAGRIPKHAYAIASSPAKC